MCKSWPGLKGLPGESFRTSSFFDSSRLASSVDLFSSEVDCAAEGKTACIANRQTTSRRRREYIKKGASSDRDRNPVNCRSHFTAPPSSWTTRTAARLGLSGILSLGFPKTRPIPCCAELHSRLGQPERVACGSI